MFSGMVWIARSGAPWRDLSERYGSCIFRKAHGKAVQKWEKMEPLFSGKDLRKLIIPLIFEQALAITVGMADTMMISSVGEAAVSGV